MINKLLQYILIQLVHSIITLRYPAQILDIRILFEEYCQGFHLYLMKCLELRLGIVLLKCFKYEIFLIVSQRILDALPGLPLIG